MLALPVIGALSAVALAVAGCLWLPVALGTVLGTSAIGLCLTLGTAFAHTGKAGKQPVMKSAGTPCKHDLPATHPHSASNGKLT